MFRFIATDVEIFLKHLQDMLLLGCEGYRRVRKGAGILSLLNEGPSVLSIS